MIRSAGRNYNFSLLLFATEPDTFDFVEMQLLLKYAFWKSEKTTICKIFPQNFYWNVAEATYLKSWRSDNCSIFTHPKYFHSLEKIII